MKNGTVSLTLATFATLAVLAGHPTPRSAFAGEPPDRHDVETDHVDAFDDVGPRSYGAFARAGIAGGAGGGLWGAGTRIGAEVDVGLGDTVAASVIGEGSPSGYGAAIGLPVFPGRVPFHGLYVHPRLTWRRMAVDGSLGSPVDCAGVATTVGGEWTLRPGFTLRAGIGLAYDAPVTDLAGGAVVPTADAAVGWVF